MEDYGIRKEYDNLRINELRLKRRIEELESDKKALTEQLRITSVSQQRELLENFADWMDKNVNFDGIRQEEIDSYIAEKIL